MALKADAQGFLAGDPIDIGTALGLWRNIGADVRAIRQSLLGNASRPQVSASRGAGQQRYESARAPAVRDSKGRFVSAQVATPGRSSRVAVPSAGNRAERTMVPAIPAPAVVPGGRLLSLSPSTSEIQRVDPAVAAFNEIAQPLARGWELLSGGDDDKKQTGLLRRIFGFLKSDQKEDSAFQRAAQRSLGVIESNSNGQGKDAGGGWIASLLGSLGLSSLVPILTKVASVVGGLALAIAPLLVMLKVKGWIEDDSHDGERVEDIKKNAADPAKEALKKVGIDKDKEIEAIRDKNRAEQNGTDEYARMDRAKASFASSSAFKDQFAGLKAGSPEFDAKWKELSANPEFNKAFEGHYANTLAKDTAPKKGVLSRMKDKFFGGKNEVGSVVETGAGFNVVKRPDGSIEKQEGARNWRNNNPGNIEAGKFAEKHGAIGSDGRFAIFPSYEAGRNAKEKLIFDGAGGKQLSTKADYGAGLGYKDKLLTQAIAAYAPPEDKNNLPAYQRAVLDSVGGANKRMGDYSPAERKQIMDAMERQEGFKPGRVTQVAQGVSLEKAVQPPAQAITTAVPVPSVPKIASAPPIGDAPPVISPLNTPSASKPTRVIQPKDVGQDLSDRRIAHIVTGGLSNG